jgi:hypothetical protein
MRRLVLLSALLAYSTSANADSHCMPTIPSGSYKACSFVELGAPDVWTICEDTHIEIRCSR